MKYLLSFFPFNPHPNKGGSGQIPCIYLLHNCFKSYNYLLVLLSDQAFYTSGNSVCYSGCSPVLFYNICMILQLLLSLSVGSCCYERSFSTLRRLKTFLRTTTYEERLKGLALAYMHYTETLMLIWTKCFISEMHEDCI